MAIGFKSTHQNCYSYYGGWNARFKLPNKNHRDNAFPFPLQFQLHLKLDNYHAAYAAIIVAIKSIICSLSKPATAATNKANGGCWFQWIVSNCEYNTFKPVVHFYFSDAHYAIWLRYNFISTFCSEKSSFSFNSTRYSSGALAHFGHSVMLYFFLVKLKQFQQLTKLTQTNNENCHHKESYKNGTVSQRCCATDFPFLSPKLMQSIFFLMLAFNFFSEKNKIAFVDTVEVRHGFVLWKYE